MPRISWFCAPERCTTCASESPNASVSSGRPHHETSLPHQPPRLMVSGSYSTPTSSNVEVMLRLSYLGVALGHLEVFLSVCGTLRSSLSLSLLQAIKKAKKESTLANIRIEARQHSHNDMIRLCVVTSRDLAQFSIPQCSCALALAK